MYKFKVVASRRKLCRHCTRENRGTNTVKKLETLSVTALRGEWRFHFAEKFLYKSNNNFFV